MTLPEILITASSSAAVLKALEYLYDWLKTRNDTRIKFHLSASDQLTEIQKKSDRWAKELLKAKDALNMQITSLKIEVALLRQENERLKNADK
jgi:hypothetical protein